MKRISILLVATALAACSSQDNAGDSGAAQAPVAMAPGNSITSAAKAKIGMTVTGEIKKDAATSQFFYFENGGKLRDVVLVRLENKSGTLKPSIKIFNSERSQLDSKYDATPGANVEVPVGLDPGQSLYVEVEPYGSEGAYALSAIPQKAYDAHEANDDQLHATAVNFGNAVEASIMDGKDADWFHFTATSGPKVTIALENLSTTLRPAIRVYSAAKSEVTYKYDATPGAGLELTADLQPGQDFYVQVEPYNSPGKYRLSARAAVMAGDMASALKAKGLVDLYGIYFDTDQAFVKPESAATLTEVANLLKSDASLRLEIAGHTDNAGTKDHNMTLSQARANAVIQALAGQFGISAGRLVAKGYGDTRPMAPNDNPSNMAKNRRVELRKL